MSRKKKQPPADFIDVTNSVRSVQPKVKDPLLETIIDRFMESIRDDARLIEQIDSLGNDRIKALVEASAKRIEIVVPDKKEPIDAGIQHRNFEVLLRVLGCKLPPYLVGPAGSGKTVSVYNAAKALGMEFGAVSVGPQTTQSQIFGYKDAHGNYQETEFRKRYEHGGVFLFDELDAGNAQVLTSINSALSNDYCAFPDGMIKKHPDFVCAASGNTYGRGATREYVGRNQIDAATLDRFVLVEWPYDEQLERQLVTNFQWVYFVQKVRANAEKHGIKMVISQRASIYGEKLLAAGIGEAAVRELLIFKGVDIDTKKKLIQDL